jgi:hypothetical protein
MARNEYRPDDFDRENQARRNQDMNLRDRTRWDQDGGGQIAGDNRRARDQQFGSGGNAGRGSDPYSEDQWFGERWGRNSDLPATRPQSSSDQSNMGSAQQQKGRYGGKGPQGYKRSAERLTEEVNDRLMWDSEVDATNISVSVEDGEVTLEGSVEDRFQKRAAEDCCYGVSGVTNVYNHLRIQPASAVSSQTAADKKKIGGEEGQSRQTDTAAEPTKKTPAR